MINCIAIRKETKDRTQRRAPLSPDHVRILVKEQKIRVLVEPWDRRIFTDKEYADAGAELTTRLDEANIVFGVKEIAPKYLGTNTAYCFFSHTVKGQAYNMPMLKAILDRKNSLFDYELVKNTKGKRLIFFGEYAGYAGMIDTIWALGKRLSWEGMNTPFTKMKYATAYQRLEDVRDDFRAIGSHIRSEGLPPQLVPFVSGFTGYGHVSKAAQELYDLLPVQTLQPSDLAGFFSQKNFSDRVVYKVEFRKPDLYAPADQNRPFVLREFNEHPEKFVSLFDTYLPFLTVIINGIYWEPRYPRLVTRNDARELYHSHPEPRLRVIGDITCDIDGSIELTVKATDSEEPVYVFDPIDEAVHDGWEGRGPVVLAVDKLPTELPREASESFGSALLPFVPQLAKTDFGSPLNELDLPPEFSGALIVHRGTLTPPFQGLLRYLKR